jgi:hypothetical protein
MRGAVAWIPFTAIAPESKVLGPGDSGTLAIVRWLADRFPCLD